MLTRFGLSSTLLLDINELSRLFINTMTITMNNNRYTYCTTTSSSSSRSRPDGLDWIVFNGLVLCVVVVVLQEMTKIVQAIYDMLGNSSSSRPPDTAEERAKSIFARMDENGDGKLTEEEFLKGCLQDEELSKMLSPGF